MTSRLERHLAKGEEMKVKDDVFLIKPIGAGMFPEMFKLQGIFARSKDDPGTLFDLMGSKENFALVNSILDRTLELSFPEETKAVRDEFKAQHFWNLLPIVVQANSSSMKIDDEKKEELMKFVKARQT